MNGKSRSIALPRAIDNGTLVPKTMNFRLAAIGLRFRYLALTLVLLSVTSACDRTIGEGGVLNGLVAVAPASALDSRPLTPYQMVALNHLAFPQTADSILSRFGEPAYSNGDSDYYPLPNGGTAIVTYLGHRAQSVEVR